MKSRKPSIPYIIWMVVFTMIPIIMIGDVIEKIFWTDQNTGSAISLILMIFIFVFLIIMNLFGDEEAIA